MEAAVFEAAAAAGIEAAVVSVCSAVDAAFGADAAGDVLVGPDGEQAAKASSRNSDKKDFIAGISNIYSVNNTPTV
ncbi:hypothetical protein C7N83_10095 [Neisseria iguanae]|uniref:Uncharacterized protein n=1 Tax=Neisseria iguanae TaxID=90242 RepID=A0A2P7TYI1_9NEIS|nr:hypothetical protein C7N83_10095 [Neisseria iguanae]